MRFILGILEISFKKGFEMKTALFVGRFQPFHKGHEHVLKSLFRKFNKIIIVIGSINKMNKENPFSFYERKKMIDTVFTKYKKRYKIIGIPDIGSDQKWTKNILKKAKLDVVVTGNNWTKRCFKNFKISKPEFLKPKKYNATKIRKMIRKNKDWKNLVPKSLVSRIEKSLP